MRILKNPVEQTPGLRYGNRADEPLSPGEEISSAHRLIRIEISIILVNISMTDS
jgi:hypothetical protein